MRTDVTLEQRTLDMLKVGVQRMVARELVNDAQFVSRTAKVSVMREFPGVEYHLGNMLAVQLRAYVLAEKVHDDFHSLEFKWPASWWQHFKIAHKRFIPQWYLKRWPVRYQTTVKTIDLKVYHGYPDARMALPEEEFGQRVVFATVTPARETDED